MHFGTGWRPSELSRCCVHCNVGHPLVVSVQHVKPTAQIRARNQNSKAGDPVARKLETRQLCKYQDIVFSPGVERLLIS